MYNFDSLDEFNNQNDSRGTLRNLALENTIKILSDDACFMCGGDHGRNQECMREFY